MDSLRQIFKSSAPTHCSNPPPTMSTVSHIIPNHITAPTNADLSTQVTILELFQSQGCNSCPPANDYLIKHYSNDRKTLLLTYEVTYWDHLGWADTFGDRRWDARQRDYAAAMRSRSVYTPQAIVDGGSQPISSWQEVPKALGRRGVAEVKLNVMAREGGRIVEVEEWQGASKNGLVAPQVLAVYYEEKPADVNILRGENRGATLPHRNIVRDLVVLGEYRGDKEVFEVPNDRLGLRMCVLVQAGRGGKILGAVA